MKVMAIAIKNIPVLTGKDPEHFNHIVEKLNSVSIYAKFWTVSY